MASNFCSIFVPGYIVLIQLIMAADAEIKVELNEDRYLAKTGERTVPRSKLTKLSIPDRQASMLDSSDFGTNIRIYHEIVVDACRTFPRRVLEVVEANKDIGWVLLIQISAACSLERQLEHVNAARFDYLIFYESQPKDDETYPISSSRAYELRATGSLSVSFVTLKNAILLQKIAKASDLYTLKFVKNSRYEASKPTPTYSKSTSSSNKWNTSPYTNPTSDSLDSLIWDQFLTFVIFPLGMMLGLGACALIALGLFLIMGIILAVFDSVREPLHYQYQDPIPPSTYVYRPASDGNGELRQRVLLSPRREVEETPDFEETQNDDYGHPRPILPLHNPRLNAYINRLLQHPGLQMRIADLNEHFSLLFRNYRGELLERMPDFLSHHSKLTQAELIECQSCFICEEVFQEGELVPRLEHGCLQKQKLHPKCLERWWKETVQTNLQIRCPICRADIKDELTN